jgi:hypothetical protein
MRLPLLFAMALLAASPATAESVHSASVPTDLSAVRGFNFTPVAADAHEAFWLNYPAEEIDRDFGYAQQLNLNQVRVFVRSDAWDQDSKTFTESLNKFMDAAQRHHLGVMLVLAPSAKTMDGLSGVAQAAAEAKLKAWVVSLARIVRDKPAMAFWDVANEPDWPGYADHRRSNTEVERRMNLARTFADTVHANDKKHATTVGCFRVGCMEDLANYTDVFSFHDYPPTVARAQANIKAAQEIAAKHHKQVFDTEMGCIARADPYDMVLREYKKSGMGFYIWELMITKSWGNVHGVFYGDGSVRDPVIAAAIMGFFRNQTKETVLEDPDREGWVTASIAAGKAWLAEPNPAWEKGLIIAEVQANLLEGAQLVAMRNPPTSEIVLLRQGSQDISILKKIMERYISLLEPYEDHPPLHPHSAPIE